MISDQSAKGWGLICDEGGREKADRSEVSSFMTETGTTLDRALQNLATHHET